MTAYIKLSEKVKIIGQKKIYLNDLGKIYCSDIEVQKSLEKILIFEIIDSKKKNYLIDFFEVIKKADKIHPGLKIENLGSEEVIITYVEKAKKKNLVLDFAKIFFVASSLFLGSATAIISFHIDSDIPKIFRSFYYIFFNETVENPYIMDIPYSIGISLGILVFFNRFNKKEEKDEPSPIDIEISSYEEEKLATLKTNLKSRDDKNVDS